MNYIDLHCDALTAEGVVSVTAESLRAGGCILQCFAAFVNGGKGEGYERAAELCDRFDAMCAREGFSATPHAGGVCAVLTAEGGEAIGGDLEKLGALSARGVKMLGLTWNYPNGIGGCAAPALRSPRETSYGLTPFGRECVARMCELNMLPDVSHGSDALVRDVAAVCKGKGMPFLASHSDARAVFFHPRNLTDEGIRLVAESGGVVGLNFYDGFLSADKTPEGQKTALLAHARHIVARGGEDVLALGTDFDGAPANPYIANPSAMPRFLSDLEREFGTRIAEKIAFGNAMRVLGVFEA